MMLICENVTGDSHPMPGCLHELLAELSGLSRHGGTKHHHLALINIKRRSAEGGERSAGLKNDKKVGTEATQMRCFQGKWDFTKKNDMWSGKKKLNQQMMQISSIQIWSSIRKVQGFKQQHIEERQHWSWPDHPTDMSSCSLHEPLHSGIQYPPFHWPYEIWVFELDAFVQGLGTKGSCLGPFLDTSCFVLRVLVLLCFLNLFEHAKAMTK